MPITLRCSGPSSTPIPSGASRRSIRSTASSTCPAHSPPSDTASPGASCRSRTSRSRSCRASTIPRMYFAIGRGSLGGGRLRSEAFTAKRLEQQLAAVAAECVQRNECFRYDPDADRIEISPIFGWRQAEFTKTWSGDPSVFAKRSPDRARRPADGVAACAAKRGARADSQHLFGRLLGLRLAPQRSHRRRTSLRWIWIGREGGDRHRRQQGPGAWLRRAALVAEGARVAICGRTPATLEHAAEALGAVSGRTGDVLAVEADVSRESDLRRLVDATVERFGGVDVLVNNVGLGQGRRPDGHA